MIPIALAALSALVWGTGDFCGGKASQRAPALGVAVWSKVASVPLLALYLVLMPATPDAGSMWWAAAAGGAGMTGIVLFYRALSMGAMVVVAPISAVVTALVPFVVGLLIEPVPAPLALTGAVVALVAIALVSLAPDADRVRVTSGLVGLALGAGAGFGLFFVLLDRAGAAAGDDAGLWPIAGAQASAIVLGGLLLLWTLRRRHVAGPADRAPIDAPAPASADPPADPPAARRWGVDRATVRFTLAAGALDMSANALYLLAVQGDRLSIVAPIAALYPASTVLLALFVEREPIRPIQLAGLGLAATALVLVAA